MPGETDQTHLLQLVYAGRWRVDGKLGEGGMGSVLRATDTFTGEAVALKTLGVHLADNPEFLKRFEREASLLEKLSHPALPRFLGLSRHSGMPFFVMQLVEGRPVSALVREKKPLEPTLAASILRQLGDVLTYLHSRGVVHRDLKPENLLLDGDGRLTLVDFGISAETGVTRLTLPGLALGTPLYMAPEQITAGQATPASDVYAMGMLAFTLLTGQHPFAKEDRAGLLTRQVREAPPLANTINAQVPRSVAGVLKRAMEKAPEARFTSANEFVQALELAWAMERVPSFDDVTDDGSDDRTELAPAAGGRAPAVGRAAVDTDKGVVLPTRPERPVPVPVPEITPADRAAEPTQERPRAVAESSSDDSAVSTSDPDLRAEPTVLAPRASSVPPPTTDPGGPGQKSPVDVRLVIAWSIFALLLVALAVLLVR